MPMNPYEKELERLEIQRRECESVAEVRMIEQIQTIYKILIEMRKLKDAQVVS